MNPFSSPAELVNYLEYLDNNSTAYLEYHAWRKDDADLSLPYIQPTDKMICGSCKVNFRFNMPNSCYQEAAEKLGFFRNSRDSSQKDTQNDASNLLLHGGGETFTMTNASAMLSYQRRYYENNITLSTELNANLTLECKQKRNCTKLSRNMKHCK